MELGRYRDVARIYLLIAGAFSVTFFFRWVMIGYMIVGALGAVICGVALFIFLVLGLAILYFGLEEWDRFYSNMTVPRSYHAQVVYPQPGFYYQQPAAYSPGHGQPAYYPPGYGLPAYGMPAYYGQYPVPPPAYRQPQAGYQPYPAPSYPVQPAFVPQPYVVAVAVPHRDLDPRRALILPDAHKLLAIFLLSVLAGGLALAAALYVHFAAIIVFLPAFVIGFSFPSMIWISYVYSFEKTHLLPSKTVLKAFVWGMLSTIPALLVNTAAALILGEGPEASLFVTLAVASVVAPLIEEFSKPWGVPLVRSDVRGPLDGLILGVTCGVGFALIENISYEFSFVLTGQDAAAVWTLGSLARGLGSIMVHATGAGMIGYAYGRYRAGGSLPPIGLAYMAAVGMHSAWNGISTVLGTYDMGVYATVPFMGIFVVVTYVVLRRLIDSGAAQEAAAGRTAEPPRVA